MVTVATRIEDELARRGIKLRRAGAEYYGPCPICQTGVDRFSVNVRKQLWNCRGCTDAAGDVIGLVRRLDRCDFRTALKTLDVEARPSPAARPAQSESPSVRAGDDNSNRALALWWAAKPIVETLAETYLHSRGLEYIDLEGDVLRFHPHCPFGGVSHPCMIALFRTITGGNKPVAIHRTALRSDGTKIDRRTLGPVGSAAIKLTPDEDVTTGLCIGEGIETTLAGVARDFRPVWALGSAAGIAKFPALSGIETLTILVDHDRPDRNGRQAGHVAARECGDRWKAADREVFYILPDEPGVDMADLVGKAP
jgi:CHC2 zinc finger/Toprim domain